jgi:SPP1 gp7 family putative phage head morphogenesis protein
VQHLPPIAWVMPMPDPIRLSFNQPFYRAVEELKKRGVVLPDKYYGEMQGLHRQLNFSIAGKASLDQLQAALDSLEKAMNEGQTFAKWQKDIRVQDLGLPKHRLDNIFRTNIQAAYNRGHWEKFVEHQKTRPYLMYDAINDSRVRPTHLAMDGIIRPVGDSFWNSHYPPNGFRCRCRCISLNERQAQERSKNGQGLNKSISDEMKPDKGFDYNVGTDLTAGVNKAIKDSKANPVLKSAVEKTLAKPPPAPVSNALKLPKSGYAKTPSKSILAIIDSIHSDGELPEIPIKASASRKFYGAYEHKIQSKESVAIHLSSYGDHPELTLAHEIGHFIDHQAFGEKGFSSTNNEMFAGWRDAVDNSNATKEIKSIGGSKSSYYLSTHEQWARSYAQYIATKSGDVNLIKQLDDIRNSDRVAPIRKSSQWQDDDFELISKEIDKLFLKMRWL